jgi:xanthine dehydrogenase small subunit
MVNFILNDKDIATDLLVETCLLDFLRHQQRLVGTKAGCREGDCGACLILVGESKGQLVSYQPANSCLLSLGQVHGKHVITIEGLNQTALTPIQQALLTEGATQCGYCTPGIVLALTGLFFNSLHFDSAQLLAAIDGNLCRCTGYQAIKRALCRVCQQLLPSSGSLNHSKIERIAWLVENQIIPSYCLQIPPRLQKYQPATKPNTTDLGTFIAGGTDLWLQRTDTAAQLPLIYLSTDKSLKGIRIEKNHCYIGATTTVEEIKNSPIIQAFFPKMTPYFKLIAATPIRYQATVGGNIVRASPVGDLTIFFLVLETTLHLTNGHIRRTVALKDFFTGYQQVNKQPQEWVESLSFPLPAKHVLVNFEKVSKRTHLDVASVNSAMQIHVEKDTIQQLHLSAGGVAPIPLYLTKTVNFAIGKPVTAEVIRQAVTIAQTEITPISDIRGSAEYKRLLLRQLIYAHFITLFPKQITLEALLP